MNVHPLATALLLLALLLLLDWTSHASRILASPILVLGLGIYAILFLIQRETNP